jgi:hypothetical protein
MSKDRSWRKERRVDVELGKRVKLPLSREAEMS